MEYEVTVYKIESEAKIKIEADSADQASGMAIDQIRNLAFKESTRKFEAEAVARRYTNATKEKEKV